MCRLTKESIEALIEEIIDAVEMEENRDTQFEFIRVILESQGIIEEVE